MKKLKTYTVIVGKRNDICVNEGYDIEAFSKKEAKEMAKRLVPMYWKPVIRDIWVISE